MWLINITYSIDLHLQSISETTLVYFIFQIIILSDIFKKLYILR